MLAQYGRGRGYRVPRTARSTVLGLLVAGLVGLIADPALGNHKLIAERPWSVGAVYPTDPPPLASLKGVLGEKPSPDNLDLYVRSFARVIFEPRNHRRYPWILKWSKPVKVGLKRNPKNRHVVLLPRVVEDLERITGLPMEATAIAPFDISIEVSNMAIRHDIEVSNFHTRYDFEVYCSAIRAKTGNGGPTRMKMGRSTNQERRCPQF